MPHSKRLECEDASVGFTIGLSQESEGTYVGAPCALEGQCAGWHLGWLPPPWSSKKLKLPLAINDGLEDSHNKGSWDPLGMRIFLQRGLRSLGLFVNIWDEY
jgi:hypothetical protein